MKLRRIRALAVKELLQVMRDPRSLMLALAMPIMQLFLLGYGVNLDISHVPVCVYDQEGSQFSQSLFKHVQASPYFRIVRDLHNDREIRQVMDDGTCRMALVVPADFSRQIMLERHASVQAIVDATDDNTATLATAYADAVVAGFSSDVQLNLVERTTGMPLLPAPVAEQSRVWFNEDLESRNFIIPGVVALVLALVGAQLTSLTIAREWERGTMELLISTPVTPMELLFGKLLPYFFIGMVDALICLVVAVFWFGVPFRGELSALLFTTSLFLVVVLSVGYFVSVAIPNQIGASQIALFLTIMPISLLSGYAFPIDQMPAAIRLITYGIYARYYVTILKSLFLKGSSLYELWLPVLALTGYAVAMAWLAARAFHKRIG
ncbi:MAG TPA: ABC transporter permease [Dyella sp.]|uniref:ABC transporter permease n=1 Tax=Dyella sp. TaxID=1869338 RepID=UPI002CE3B44E|nr:ABC transporter permease [Dyella sp.]HUB90362.1 ABC transporter permease [Dyella sp.]